MNPLTDSFQPNRALPTDGRQRARVLFLSGSVFDRTRAGFCASHRMSHPSGIQFQWPDSLVNHQEMGGTPRESIGAIPVDSRQVKRSLPASVTRRGSLFGRPFGSCGKAASSSPFVMGARVRKPLGFKVAGAGS